MKSKGYNEQRRWGNLDFPVEYHYVTCHHPRYHMPYHWHIECELIRVLRGRILLSLNEKNYQINVGDLLFVADGIVHGGAAQGYDCVYECVVFELQVAHRICRKEMKEILAHKILIRDYFTEAQPQIQQAAASVFDAMKQARPGYELVVQGGLYQLLGLVIGQKLYTRSEDDRLTQGNSRRISQLKQAFRLIETDYAQPITLQQLADAAGLSAKYFCRFFKEMTRRTPIDYLNYYRIECACDQLASEEHSITEIAFACGFNDFSYFIKTFRRYKGTTPHQFLLAYKRAERQKDALSEAT